MRFNRLKPQNWLFTILIVFFAIGSKAWAIPQENILLIYYADTTGQTCVSGGIGVNSVGDAYPQNLEADFATALAPPLSASVQTLQVHNGDVGITSELTAQYPGLTLANWCQVYDLRFLNDCDNLGGTTIQVDDITPADMVLYRAYLAQGGSLFLQGEHHDFYQRNNNLLQLVNSVASVPVVSTVCSTYICPDVNGTNPYFVWNNCFTTNYGFNTNDNNLSNPTSMVGLFVGAVPAGDYGSGLPLITVPGPFTYGGASPGAEMLAWEGGALNAPYSAGKLVASFETNAWATANFGSGILQSTYANPALQNVYTLLSGCLHYTVTKTFNPTSLSVGQTGTFSICATNTSTLVSINNYSISDTIATCLTYNSSTSTPTSGTGNQSAGTAGTLYWWTFGTIAPGASACVTVNFTASNTTCP
jgi:uncharacterized repeat protein (TIGR01451 family)